MAAAPALDRPGAVRPDRAWDHTHLKLDLRIDPRAKTVSGSSRITATRIGPGNLTLHQVALHIDRVVVDGAENTGWRAGDSTLSIPIDPEDDAIDVVISYKATPQTGLHFRGEGADKHVEVWSQGQDSDNRYWFPAWDHPSDRMTVDVNLTVPDGLVALAVGEEVARQAADRGWTTWQYHLGRAIPSYAVAIAVGDYRVVRVDGPVPLELVVGKEVSEDTARKQLGDVGDILTWLAATLDEPNPWGVYRQVAVQRFLYGAMENPNLVIIDDKVVLGREPRSRRLVLTHEAVHQWFGNLITPLNWRDKWLSEGFATYFEARWQAHQEGNDRFAERVEGWARVSVDSEPVSPRAWSRTGPADYSSVYTRGAFALHALDVMLGDDVLLAAVRDYINRNHDSLVTTADFQRVVEEHAGRDLSWFFDGLLHAAGAPTVTTSWRYDEETLTLDLVQAEGDTWSAPVWVEVGDEGGVTRHHLWVEPGAHHLAVSRNTPPLWVAVDPEGGVLAHWTHNQPPASWRAAAKLSPSPLVRRRAIHWLGNHVDDPGLAVLTALAASGPEDRRIAAVVALGDARKVPDPLISVLSDESSYIRRAAADGLGRFQAAAQLVGPLRRCVSDPVDEVRAACLDALAHQDPHAAVVEARVAVGRVRANSADVNTAASVLGQHGERADINRLRVLLAATTPSDIRHAAAWAAAAAVTRLEGVERDAVSRSLWPLLEDTNLRTRETAVAVLGEMGSKESEASLRALAARSTLPGLADSARDAAAKCANRDNKATPVVPNAALLLRLEALEERLERMETWR